MPLFKKKKDRKKFSETKVGAFLKEHAPSILDVVDDFIPPAKILTNLIAKDEKLTTEQKEQAFELMKLELEFFKIESEAITDRWKADTDSGHWLAVNARPLVLLSSVLMLFVFIILDSCGIRFDIKESWISLYEVVLVTTIGGYFGLRSWEKTTAMKK